MARVLGASDRGMLAAVTYWPHLLVGLIAMGLNEGVVVRISTRGYQSSLVSTVVATSFLLAAVASLVCWVALEYTLGSSRSEYVTFARVYACVLAFSSYTYINLLAVSQGSMRFNTFNALRITQAAIYPAALLLLWMSGLISVRTAAAAMILGGVLVAFALLFKYRVGLWHFPSLKKGLELGRESFKIHLVNVVMLLSEQLGKMIIVLFASNVALGYYVVAYTAAAAAPSVLVQTYINVMLPTAARSEGSGVSRNSVMRSLVSLSALVVLVVMGLILALPVFLPLVFGAEYAPAIIYAQVLCVAVGISGLRKSLVYLLRSWRITRPALWGEVSNSLCIALFGYPAFLSAGVLGVCWVLVGAQLLGAAIVWKGFHLAANSHLRAEMGPTTY